MKTLLLLLVASMSAVVFAAEQSDIYPLRPDGTRDYTKPSQRIDGDIIYQLRKDGTRDHTQPAKRVEGDRIIPLRSDGTRDYTKPVLQIQKK